MKRFLLCFLSLLLALIPVFALPDPGKANPVLRVVAGSAAERGLLGLAERAGMRFVDDKAFREVADRLEYDLKDPDYDFTASKQAMDDYFEDRGVFTDVWNKFDPYVPQSTRFDPSVRFDLVEDLVAQLSQSPEPIPHKPGWGKIAIDAGLFLIGADILFNAYDSFKNGQLGATYKSITAESKVLPFYTNWTVNTFQDEALGTYLGLFSPLWNSPAPLAPVGPDGGGLLSITQSGGMDTIRFWYHTRSGQYLEDSIRYTSQVIIPVGTVGGVVSPVFMNPESIMTITPNFPITPKENQLPNPTERITGVVTPGTMIEIAVPLTETIPDPTKTPTETIIKQGEMINRPYVPGIETLDEAIVQPQVPGEIYDPTPIEIPTPVPIEEVEPLPETQPAPVEVEAPTGTSYQGCIPCSKLPPFWKPWQYFTPFIDLLGGSVIFTKEIMSFLLSLPMIPARPIDNVAFDYVRHAEFLGVHIYDTVLSLASLGLMLSIFRIYKR